MRLVYRFTQDLERRLIMGCLPDQRSRPTSCLIAHSSLDIISGSFCHEPIQLTAVLRIEIAPGKVTNWLSFNT